jgi:hypothetical protein
MLEMNLKGIIATDERIKSASIVLVWDEDKCKPGEVPSLVVESRIGAYPDGVSAVTRIATSLSNAGIGILTHVLKQSAPAAPESKD